MDKNYFAVDVTGEDDADGYVVVEVSSYVKQVHAGEGYMSIVSADDSGEGLCAYLSVRKAKALRKALKEAIKYLES